MPFAGETDLIAFLREKLQRPKYLRSWLDDDCEIVELDATGRFLLVTIDTSTADVDFPREAPSCLAGYFSASLTLSDIAACGGVPVGILVSVSVPPDFTHRLRDLYQGIEQAAFDGGTFILGGDTNSANELSISVVGIGHVDRERVLRRRTAKVGDLVGVTGKLGRYNRGYWERVHGLDANYESMLAQKPPVAKGIALAATGCVSSCIDLPDGLVKALRDNAATSYGYLINDVSIPLTRRWSTDLPVGLAHRFELASCPAGDVELLFTASESSRTTIEEECASTMRIHWIGSVTAESGVEVATESAGRIRPSAIGFEHLFGTRGLFASSAGSS